MGNETFSKIENIWLKYPKVFLKQYARDYPQKSIAKFQILSILIQISSYQLEKH